MGIDCFYLKSVSAGGMASCSCSAASTRISTNSCVEILSLIPHGSYNERNCENESQSKGELLKSRLQIQILSEDEEQILCCLTVFLLVFLTVVASRVPHRACGL